MDFLNYTDAVYERIANVNKEEVFIALDFLDIADYHTVRQSLLRLEKYGKIKKIMNGVYYNPQYSKMIKEYEAPSPHHVAMALARKFNWTIAPSGNTALNQLGLSTQVTTHWLYISDGPYHKFQFNNVELEFKHRNNKEISGMSYKTAMVIQAMKTLGKENIDKKVIDRLKMQLTGTERDCLLQEARQTTAWVYQKIRLICEEQT